MNRESKIKKWTEGDSQTDRGKDAQRDEELDREQRENEEYTETGKVKQIYLYL